MVLGLAGCALRAEVPLLAYDRFLRSSNLVTDDPARNGASDSSQRGVGNRSTSRGAQPRTDRGITPLFTHGTAGRQARQKKHSQDIPHGNSSLCGIHAR